MKHSTKHSTKHSKLKEELLELKKMAEDTFNDIKITKKDIIKVINNTGNVFKIDNKQLVEYYVTYVTAIGHEMIKENKSLRDFINVVSEVQSIIDTVINVTEIIDNIQDGVCTYLEYESDYLNNVDGENIYRDFLSLSIRDKVNLELISDKQSLKPEQCDLNFYHDFAKKIGAKDGSELTDFIFNNQLAIEVGLRELNIEPTLELVTSSLIAKFKDKYNYELQLDIDDKIKSNTIFLSYSIDGQFMLTNKHM